MSDQRQEKIARLKQQLAELEAAEKTARLMSHKKAIEAATLGMSYEEMCELREVLNERIRSKYASDAIDDE